MRIKDFNTSKGFTFTINMSLFDKVKGKDEYAHWLKLVDASIDRIELAIPVNEEKFSKWKVAHRSLSNPNYLDYNYVRFESGGEYFEVTRSECLNGYSDPYIQINGKGEPFLLFQ